MYFKMHNFNQPQENNVGLTIPNARIKILNDWWNNVNRPIEQNIETNKIYKIKIFADFGESSYFKHVFEQICETDKMENYGIDKEIYITDGDDYTHALLLNNCMPNLNPNIPKKNIVALAYEPPIFIIKDMHPQYMDYLEKYVGKYLIGDVILQEPFVCKYSYMTHITPLRHIPMKTKRMSIIISRYNSFWFGYSYRHKLAQHILMSNLPIDIYGNGCDIHYNNVNDSRLKGEFHGNEPYEEYDFHICIENFQTECYFSEKVISPLLTNTTPIYFGARKITDYVGDNIVTMSGNIENDLQLLASILNNPMEYKKNIDVEFIKKKVFLLHNLDNIFD